MSRISCSIPGDDDCIVGYDLPLRSFFFMSGRESKDGTPKIWLGRTPCAFPSIGYLEDELRLVLVDPNFEFSPADRGAIMGSAVIDIQADLAAGLIDARRAGALIDKVSVY